MHIHDEADVLLLSLIPAGTPVSPAHKHRCQKKPPLDDSLITPTGELHFPAWRSKMRRRFDGGYDFCSVFRHRSSRLMRLTRRHAAVYVQSIWVSSRRTSLKSLYLSRSPPILSSASSMTTEFPRITWGRRVSETRFSGFEGWHPGPLTSRQKPQCSQHTTMPSLTFSPPSFSSTASSKTMFKKT